MEEFDQILSEATYSTTETVERMKTRYTEEEIEQMRTSEQEEISRLRAKYEESNIPEEEMVKRELTDNMTQIINLINIEYSGLIPSARLEKLNSMLDGDSIIVFNDENDTHDFSINSESGKLIVNIARLGITPNNPNPDIYTKMAKANGSLPHELFHMIIQMLKPADVADERMIIKTADGETITSRGMVGFILSEGFVEKYSLEFCEKHGIYHQVAPQYLPYIDICNYIMRKYPKVNSKTIFSLDESDVLGLLEPEEQKKYHHAEMVSYAVRHKGKKAIQVLSTALEKSPINYSLIPSEKLEKIKQYYLEKNSKLQETSAMSPEEKHTL
jgi:hypothetical protein